VENLDREAEQLPIRTLGRELLQRELHVGVVGIRERLLDDRQWCRISSEVRGDRPRQLRAVLFRHH
jgi:hypothetical protein